MGRGRSWALPQLWSDPDVDVRKRVASLATVLVSQWAARSAQGLPWPTVEMVWITLDAAHHASIAAVRYCVHTRRLVSRPTLGRRSLRRCWLLGGGGGGEQAAETHPEGQDQLGAFWDAVAGAPAAAVDPTSPTAVLAWTALRDSAATARRHVAGAAAASKAQGATAPAALVETDGGSDAEAVLLQALFVPDHTLCDNALDCY